MLAGKSLRQLRIYRVFDEQCQDYRGYCFHLIDLLIAEIELKLAEEMELLLLVEFENIDSQDY
jgi:hypothetical protein